MAKQVIRETQAISRVDALKQQASLLQEKGAKTIEKSVCQAREIAVVARKKSLEVVADRSTQVAAVSALSGGVVVGAGGAASGFVAGGTIGVAIGIIPALFTFGLSIPVCAALGAGCGVAVGGTVGGATGFTGAGAIGYGAYIKRAELAAMRLKAKTMIGRAMEKVVAARKEAQRHALRYVGMLRERGLTLMGVAIDRSTKAKAKAVVIVSDKDVQATAASAAGGAVVLGAGGAATGLAAGGAIGAAVGVLPALFTFGLSIPLCAVVGSGLGAVAGTGVGSTTGAVAGAGGYRVYKQREAIKARVGALSQKAIASAKSVKAKLQGSTA